MYLGENKIKRVFYHMGAIRSITTILYMIMKLIRLRGQIITCLFCKLGLYMKVFRKPYKKKVNVEKENKRQRVKESYKC